MARTPKVSDEEILECLAAGMRQNKIAERYGVHPTYISQRVKAMKKSSKIHSAGESSTPPESETGECVVFNIMDTVIRKKDRKWFRIIAQEDVFYELRPIRQSKTAGSTNDIDVHVKDLHKNYIKKDYPAVKVYNLADQEEKKEDEHMAEVVITEPKNEVQTPTLEGTGIAPLVPKHETVMYPVKREFLYRIDQILDAVGTGASDGIMEHTGRLVAQIIEEGIEREKENE